MTIMQRHASPDLTHIILQVLWIAILISATFWIMRPILPSLVWAGTIVAATWGLMLKIEKWLWGKRGLATAVMTVIMLLLFIIPFYLAIASIFDNADKITNWVSTLRTTGLPPLPGWIARLPIVGPKLALSWQNTIAGPQGLWEQVAPYTRVALTWFLSQIGSLAVIAVQFLLTVIIAAILYSKGEVVSSGILRFACRLGGERGQEVAILAAQTIKGVAVGVVGTAIIQSLVGGIGLAVCGIPAATLLTAVMFMLCIAQIGPGLVLFSAAIWLYYHGDATWGTVLLVWAVFAGTFDNILRPVLIKMGAALPLLLIFTGVIGGLVSFGIAGLFIGPVVLATAYKLLGVWVNNGDIQEPEKDQV